jgi:hypothetical protein
VLESVKHNLWFKNISLWRMLGSKKEEDETGKVHSKIFSDCILYLTGVMKQGRQEEREI